MMQRFAPPTAYLHEMMAHLSTAWIYDQTVWHLPQVEWINLVTIPTPDVPTEVDSPYLMALAPPQGLLEAYRSQQITWADFQHWYTAHLQGFYRWDALTVISKVLSTRASRIIILGSEAAPAEGEAAVRCARRLFYRWLLGEVAA